MGIFGSKQVLQEKLPRLLERSDFNKFLFVRKKDFLRGSMDFDS